MKKDVKAIYLNPNVDVELRVADLLSQMTIDEKIAQIGSVYLKSDLFEKGKLSYSKMKKFLKNGIGHISRIIGNPGIEPKTAAQIANKIQEFLVNETRLKIPAIIHEECLAGIMGLRFTAFPQAIGLSSSWDPDLINKIAGVIRVQMRSIGAHQGLSPVVDVLRDPRWGRTEETYGEDPYLTSCLGLAYVRGLQGDNLKNGVIATLKHFGGHSFSEGGRNLAPVNVGLRTFREEFLFPFEAIVKEGKVKSVMNSYCEVDGIPAAASKELLTDLLREEWGFDGIVVSDYSAVIMLNNFHHVAKDEKSAGCLALKAGIDIELPNTHCFNKIKEALEEGAISERIIDLAVSRVLKIKFLLGLFENPYVDVKGVSKVCDPNENRVLAREAAQQSIILLKNDGVLPLKKNIKTLAVIGPNADSTRNLFGDYHYTAHLARYNVEDSVRVVSILNGIKNKVSSKTKVYFAKGCELDSYDKNGFKEAIDIARKADAIILAIGERSGLFGYGISGEGCDRTNLNLPGVQEELLKEIIAVGKPVIVVLINGRPITSKFMVENADAILEAWYPGEEGGNAIADVIFGDYNPGGKLTVTFPLEIGQIPIHYRRKPSSYRNYIGVETKPAFPFGHGLSYAKFEYSNLEIKPKQASPDGKIEISFVVKNEGKIKGDEVVQLYISDEVGSVTRPVKELKGFKRITLKPKEKKKIIFNLDCEELAFYDKNMELIIEEGSFKVEIGSSSEDIRLKGTFYVTGTRKISKRSVFFTTSI